MDVTLNDVQTIIAHLNEGEFVYRTKFNEIYYFIYHTRTPRNQDITVVLPLMPDSDFAVCDGHLAEEELIEHLNEK